MNKIIKSFKNNILLPVSIISLIILAGLFYYLPKVTLENTLKTTAKNSDDLVTHMRIFRSYYTKKVLSKVKANTNLKINYDHDEKSDTIPLPATSIHDLGRLFTNGTDTEVRMYSNYPFPNRKDRVLDQFEKESLAFFEKDSSKPYIKKEHFNGKEVVRYAVPDFLSSQGCVNCHNSRPDTPKRDWKLGDVRGAIEIITPIDKALASNKQMQKQILVFISINILFLIGYYIFVSINQKKELQKINEKFEKNIKEQTQKLSLTSSVFENATEGITICDTNSVIVNVNKTFTNITGYTKEEAIGKHISLLKSGKQDKKFYQQMWESITKNGYWEGEITNRRKNGELFDEMLHISTIKDSEGKVSHYIAIFSDISDKRKTQESIYNLAHFDSLTKIANRNFFQKKLLKAIEELKENKSLALMYIDLDRFKIVNDSLGHGIGDELLSRVTKRIQQLLGENDFFARLGGDEFAVITQGSYTAEICEQKTVEKALNIIEAVNKVFIIDNNQISIGSSIGIALYPRDAKNAQELMQYADTAMYHAKETGRNRYAIYVGNIVKETKYRYKVEQELRIAIKNSDITLAYQPIVCADGGRIKGFEVLSRWHHKELGFISPELFISIAEDRGLIADYTYSLLKAACTQVKEWNMTYNEKFYISVNISPVHFLQSDMVEKVSAILEESLLSPSNLILEITENVIIENKELVLKALNKFKELGVKVSIDDFGTGYSSIGYLKDYPINYLKIDRSFVADIPEDKNNANICSTITSLANNFNIEVIAEGVETLENSMFLKTLGVKYLQGYYFSKPKSAEQWNRFFDSYSVKRDEKESLIV